MIKTLTGNVDFIESLRGKDASFLLTLSNTDTAKIGGITQAGIEGAIYLTPTLDSEFLALGQVRSLPAVATTPTGVPTPALISRAVHLLHPFKQLEFADLGLEKMPDMRYFTIHEFGIDPSNSIANGAQIDAYTIFQKGVEFGQNYEPKGEYVILGESVPSGTTTALATALALGYDASNKFSSSYAKTPSSVRQETVQKALAKIQSDDLFERLGAVGDNMLIFNAGFILGANNKEFKTVLAGGTQMACVLLIVNSIVKMMQGAIDSSKFALATTKWIAKDANSDIEGLLQLLDFEVDAYYADFDFSLSKHPALALYDSGEAKEGVGAGGCLVYGALNGLNPQQITTKVEELLK
ncbi:MAG: nicotinate mononucleotide-dependent phosphoribosyltransferase CobT [Campylobacterota bacterium]